MPKNRLMYAGILIVAASALLWLGLKLTTITEPLLPWSTGAGIALILVGIFLEARQGKEALRPGSEPGAPLIEIPDPAKTPEPVTDDQSNA
jgi:hypothetical protein